MLHHRTKSTPVERAKILSNMGAATSGMVHDTFSQYTALSKPNLLALQNLSGL
jgi:hypothetical protein